MHRLVIIITVLGALAPPAHGMVRDIFSFDVDEIPSVGIVGTDANFVLMGRSTASEPYTLGEVTWRGFATPRSVLANEFPSWGRDLSVRITHADTGRFRDLVLGEGAFFDPGPTEFAGSSFALAGLQVEPRDLFRFEFFEQTDDLPGPDAVWKNDIEFQFHEAQLEPLLPGTVRFDTRGRDTFPTGPGEPGAGYFGISYGAGLDGPSIVGIEIDLHSKESGIWFDAFETTPDGVEIINTLRFEERDNAPLPQRHPLSGENPNNPGTYSVLSLQFEPGQFMPGEQLRFGIDTDGGLPDPANGALWTTLIPQTTIFLTLANDAPPLMADLSENGRSADAPALEMSFVDFRVIALLQADFDMDGDVDGDDFLTWQSNLGTPEDATTKTGDANGDGRVNGDDFLIWQREFGTRPVPVDPTPIAVAPVGSLAVPEPATSVLLAVLLLAILVRWRATASAF